MKLQIPDAVMRWLGPMIIIGVGILVIVGKPVGQDIFCQGTQNCLVTWVGALSGWAAALAAWATIRSLFQQASSAQKQTDFLLGDAEPTLDAIQHRERREEVVLQVRNWNRRAMIIRRIKVVTDKPVSTIYMNFHLTKPKGATPQKIRDTAFSVGSAKKFEPAIMIEGWIRREEEPPFLKITVTGNWKGGIEIADDWQDSPIEIQYELAGLRKVSRVVAHVHLASAAITEDSPLAEFEDSTDT